MLPGSAISYEEHEQAVRNMAACLEAAGWGVDFAPGKGLRPTRILGHFYAPPDSPTAVRSADAVYMACGRQYLDAADDAWQAQLDRDPVKLDQALDRLEGCVRAGGPAETVAVGGGYAYGIYQDWTPRAVVVRAGEQQTYGQCALEFEAETGFLAPPPGVSSD